MSLINNMLQELENREKTKRELPIIPLLQVKKKSKSYFFQRKMFALGFFIFILLVAFCEIFLARHHQNHSALQLNVTASEQSPFNLQESIWTKPVHISGVTSQVKDNVTELSFLLNHPALYRIITDGFRNQISIIIENAVLQAELPQISALNTGVQQIKVQKLGKDTRFLLTLLPNTEVHYVNLNDEKNNTELVVALTNPGLSAASTQEFNSQLVKTPVMQNVLNQTYQSAIDTIQKGDYELTQQMLINLIQKAPAYHQARTALVTLLLQNHQTAKASKLLDEGIRIQPDYSTFIELKARILTEQGKIQAALDLLHTHVPPIEENPNYHALIAALYERNNQDQLAVKIYRNLVGLDEHNGNWWFGLGVSLEKLNKIGAAVTAYNQALYEGKLPYELNTFLRERLKKFTEANNAKA